MNNSYGTNILITKKDYLIKVQKEKTNDDMALSPILKKERKEKKKKSSILGEKVLLSTQQILSLFFFKSTRRIRLFFI